ncbi:hypothetical protein D3C85_379810 [compost metagenome]
MRIYRSLIGYAFTALAFIGYSGFGWAAEPYQVVDALRYAIADVGHYGAESAKCTAELAHAVSMDSVAEADRTGLLTDGHGFLQARADATVGQGVGSQVALT